MKRRRKNSPGPSNVTSNNRNCPRWKKLTTTTSIVSPHCRRLLDLKNIQRRDRDGVGSRPLGKFPHVPSIHPSIAVIEKNKRKMLFYPLMARKYFGAFFFFSFDSSAICAIIIYG
jgi:hypothetical protein